MAVALTDGYAVCSLYSGSKGNSTLISSPHAKVLIDAGKSLRALTSALAAVGTAPEEIDAVFLTHEHTDHVKALELWTAKYATPIHIVEGSAKKLFSRFTGNREVFRLHPPLYRESVGDLTFSSFIVPHDSEMCVGFRITLPDGRAVGYATDVGYIAPEVRESLLGCETVVLESNHDREMLLCGRYPRDLKMRIDSRHGHLSNSDCAAFAAELCAAGTKRLLLAHLSEENNRPEIAYDEVFAAIGDPAVSLKVADACEPVVV